MDRRPWFLRVLAVLALSSLLLAACGDDDDDTGAAEAEPGEVRIENTAFDPADTTVAVGDTVTWENYDGFAHTVTADDDSFDSGDLAEEETFEQTFDTAGTVSYHCEIHQSMQGTITVE